MIERVTSWGRIASGDVDVINVADKRDLRNALTKGHRYLATGLQRSYGDVSVNRGGHHLDMTSASRFIAFDNNSGVLQLEAGVTVREVQALFSPIGWMMPVTPGTEFVTIGGAIANDVHGKNHHVAGSIGNHLLGIEILRTDGELITCTPTENIDWFRATIGGMGLTGIILNATIQLKRTKGPWIDAEDVVFESLPEFFALSSESQATHEYSVSWIDSTTDGGRRGIFTRGNTASDQSGSAPTERVFDFVVRPPFSLVNPVTLRTFNKLYFHAKKSLATSSRIHYRPFFYPLDRIRNWNRLYGRRGFHQYQSVIPPFEAEAATQEMLKEIARSGQGSFLGVLKTFGDMEPAGMMSFPRDGVTLAIDFPERGAKTEKLFSRLDSIVGEAGGRLYPAKDDRMPRSMFEEGYSNLHEFLKFRDPGLTSELSRRLIGD